MTISATAFLLSLALFAMGGFLLGYIMGRSGPSRYYDDED